VQSNSRGSRSPRLVRVGAAVAAARNATAATCCAVETRAASATAATCSAGRFGVGDNARHQRHRRTSPPLPHWGAVAKRATCTAAL